MASSGTKGGSAWILGRISSQKKCRLPREVVGCLALEMFKQRVNVVLRDMVLWAILVVSGRLDKVILEVFFNLTDSVTPVGMSQLLSTCRMPQWDLLLHTKLSFVLAPMTYLGS